VGVIVVGIVLFFVVFFPSIGPTDPDGTSKTVKINTAAGVKEIPICGITRHLASQPNAIMHEGWYSSLSWLRDNSPEPFDDPDFYYELYETPFHYPESTYGVMSWWDYGWFIMQIAHRIPNANPGSSNNIADELDSKYVVIDFAMAVTKFYAMVEWAGGNVSDFYEVYYQQTNEGMQRGVLYYPAYYQSTVARLYNFDGKAVVPTESIVISYNEEEAATGEKYKLITNWWSFPTYEEAEAHVASQTSGNYRIVSYSPFINPMPLEELNSYELVYSSGNTTSETTVKVFEYLGSGES
jgi:asparagine N-glycosylation enzyme membrane subunit Stt3